MKLAQKRSTRADVGETATWHYPGPGPTIILVHGFRGDHHGLSAIAGALEDFTVVIPDLPGYGKTPAFSDEHSLRNYGLWLVDFVRQLGGEPIVLGHSFGSQVVAQAHELGLRSAATILLNPITTRASEKTSGQLASAYYKICRWGRFGSYLLRSALVVRAMSAGLAKTKDLKLRSFIHDQHLRFFSSFAEDRVVLEGFAAANTSSVLDYAASLPEKLLIIAGERDAIAPMPGQINLQQLTGCQLERLDVGHLTHYEAPNEAALMVREFVKAS